MKVPTVIIPKDIAELKSRMREIAGKKIGYLADKLKIKIPNSLHYTKGIVGQIFEVYLGANAANKSLPDFIHLGIELKTIPLNKNNKPAESTFVCTAPTSITPSLKIFSWEESKVLQKLSHVLWVPIQSDKEIPIRERLIGTPFLWQPNDDDMKILKQDWEELTHMLHLGDIEKLSGKYGQYLQIRPKAANSKVLINALDKYGNSIKVVPKGFYLRAKFTNKILTEVFNL